MLKDITLEGKDLEEEAERGVGKLREDGTFNGQFSDKELLDAIKWGIRQYGVGKFELFGEEDPDRGYELLYLAKH